MDAPPTPPTHAPPIDAWLYTQTVEESLWSCREKSGPNNGQRVVAYTTTMASETGSDALENGLSSWPENYTKSRCQKTARARIPTNGSMSWSEKRSQTLSRKSVQGPGPKYGLRTWAEARPQIKGRNMAVCTENVDRSRLLTAVLSRKVGLGLGPKNGLRSWAAKWADALALVSASAR